MSPPLGLSGNRDCRDLAPIQSLSRAGSDKGYRYNRQVKSSQVKSAALASRAHSIGFLLLLFML